MYKPSTLVLQVFNCKYSTSDSDNAGQLLAHTSMEQNFPLPFLRCQCGVIQHCQFALWQVFFIATDN
jgi:hypothetical protein